MLCDARVKRLVKVGFRELYRRLDKLLVRAEQALGPAGFWRPKQKVPKVVVLVFGVPFACRKEGKWAKPLLKRP